MSRRVEETREPVWNAEFGCASRNDAKTLQRPRFKATVSEHGCPETFDELSAPLGLNTTARKPRARLPFSPCGLSMVAYVAERHNNRFVQR